jgi:eukaryotic-like serine/threonine-protein kinase
MAISGVADLTGRVLTGRYRLLAPIGAGSSGRVYVADDVRLRRRVAIKVLHAALAEDSGFLRRFRSEAQVAASLNHPNVMAVYDWGDDEVPFMVLELLTGGSLRSLLDSGARLSPSQAVHVGRQVTSALEYAHARGVVHRDIKPANLLFDEHGIVRVADFGLARALAEASWTEPAGTVVGTARYAAPEQATGAPLDGRADLYSLAIVLTESVIGSVPDLAETAIGTLAARATTPLVAPLELGRLGPVVERAGRPDPAQRYPDAATMRNALTDAARTLPPPQPLALSGLFGDLDTGEPTQLGRALQTLQVFDQDAPDAPAPRELVVQEHRRRAPGAQPMVPVIVTLVVVLALGFAGYALASGTASTVPAPSVVGLDTNTAKLHVANAGLSVTLVEREADDPKGVVIAQRPDPGRFVREHGDVQLVVSRGPPPVAIADMSNVPSVDAAAALLQKQGFVVSQVRQFDDTVPVDGIIATDPSFPNKAQRDSVIKLIISDGPAPVRVQDVSGKSFDDASQILTGQKFSVTRRDDFSSTVDTDKVIGTEPAAGTSAPRGSSVTIVVSKGPELVAVPDVRGLSLEAALKKLTDLGLTGDTRGYLPGLTVKSMDPPQGSQVPKGTKVTLVF